MECKDRVIGDASRDVLTKRRVSDKTFFNQSTLVIRKRRDDAPGFKEVNMKLFENGGFQMTGVTSEEFSRSVVLWLIEFLKQVSHPDLARSRSLLRSLLSSCSTVITR
jgi:hypothetical protein